MSYSPKIILFTSIYVAHKSEKSVYLVSTLVKSLLKKVDETLSKQILDHELILTQALKFQFYVHTPQQALYGFYLELVRKYLEQKQEEIAKLYKNAQTKLNEMTYSDLYFIYSPSTIAAAALYASSIDLKMQDLVKDILTERVSDKKRIVEIVEKIEKIISEIPKDLSQIDMEKIKEITKKMEQCMNPETNPESVYFKYMKKQREEEENKRKLQKASLYKKTDVLDSIKPVDEFSISTRDTDSIFDSPNKRIKIEK